MPIIVEMLRQLFMVKLCQRDKIVVLDAPLLYETKVLEYICYPIIVVSASNVVQRERLESRDQISSEQADARIHSQMSITEKVGKADIVIDNSGTKNQLKSRTLDAIRTAVAIKEGKQMNCTVKRTTL